MIVLWVILLPARADQPKLKVGFIYPGPISDFGYTQSAEEGRRMAEKELPWLETSYVESVTDGDVESYIDEMVDEGVKVIFTVSTSFMDGTIASAARHPDVMFFSGAGYKRAPNVATYRADTYQGAYVEGLAAGALTKSGKVGSVSTYPTSDVERILDAFTIGLHEVNPKAVVKLRWLNTWYDPPATKEAAETLLGEGADYLISDMDSPTTAQVGEARGIPVNASGAYAYRDAPKCLVTASVYHWGPVYVDIFKKIHDGIYTTTNLQNVNLWFRQGEQSTQVAYMPGVLINPRYKSALDACQVSDGKSGKISVYELILKRMAQMSAAPVQFEPFTGPITDAAGKLEIPAGKTATQDELFSLSWRMPQIVGSWPSQ